MKLPFLLLAALCFFSEAAVSQKIKYVKTFGEAELKSKTENKPLAILVTMEPPGYAGRVLSGLEYPPIAEKFNTHFVNYQVAKEDTSSNHLIEKYAIKSFPHFLFIDSKGGVIGRRFGNMPLPLLENMIEDVLASARGKSLVDFDHEYKPGLSDRNFLRAYIDKRAESGLSNNAELIEEYVNNLQVKDLRNPAEIIYILKAGPIAEGRAYELLYAGSRQFVDSIFALQPINVRLAINGHIIDNTMAAAVKKRDARLAHAAAGIIRRSWLPDYDKGQRMATRRILQFYKEIGDTTALLRNIGMFYDNYYMRIGVDSVRKMERIALDVARANSLENARLNTPPGASVVSAAFAFPMQNFAGELNNGAWMVYSTGTKNPNHLIKALSWAKRSIEIKPSAATYDTMAHILYRLNFYAEAETAQETAISMARTENRNDRTFQEELTKIKKRTL